MITKLVVLRCNRHLPFFICKIFDLENKESVVMMDLGTVIAELTSLIWSCVRFNNSTFFPSDS